MGIRFAFMAALALAFSLLQGCASIVSGTTQVVSVDTPGCPAAACELANDKGKWYIPITPGTTTVSRAYGPLIVSCKNNEVAASGSFASTTKGMAFGNIIFGGVIGAGVDVSTGAAYDYPPTMSVPMSCGPKLAAAPTADAARRVRLGIKVENLTPAVAAAASYPGTEGVIVTQVDEGGAGKAMGLKVGQILTAFNGKKVAGYDSLAAELAALNEDADLQLDAWEAGRTVSFYKRKGGL